ncbi:hypothetical protein BKA62DRAFT_38082 [Auriculariales sp. MPI-PUGE-AT-0066]|nr:hypothetical protein BKA62DRAFT_38082 [Auriculariales sp. MPI-PUGE-AT-0066]
MDKRRITSHKLHGVHFHGVHAHTPPPSYSDSQSQSHNHRRAAPAPAPTPDPTPAPAAAAVSSFNGQSFALGLLTGFILCAALGALGLFLLNGRRRQQRQRKRTTLTPDKFVWSQDGLRGHHIITERVLGESAPSSPVTVGTEPWASKSMLVDLLSTSGVTLPAAMRDDRGRFTAPPSIIGSDPGQFLAT